MDVIHCTCPSCVGIYQEKSKLRKELIDHRNWRCKDGEDLAWALRLSELAILQFSCLSLDYIRYNDVNFRAHHGDCLMYCPFIFSRGGQVVRQEVCDFFLFTLYNQFDSRRCDAQVTENGETLELFMPYTLSSSKNVMDYYSKVLDYLKVDPDRHFAKLSIWGDWDFVRYCESLDSLDTYMTDTALGAISSNHLKFEFSLKRNLSTFAFSLCMQYDLSVHLRNIRKYHSYLHYDVVALDNPTGKLRVKVSVFFMCSAPEIESLCREW